MMSVLAPSHAAGNAMPALSTTPPKGGLLMAAPVRCGADCTGACVVRSNEPLNLAQLCGEISRQLSCCSSSAALPLEQRESLKRLLERVQLSPDELARYAHFDVDKRYTRNLVATEAQSDVSPGWTLMLLCWTPNKESPVHDHPSLGCWMRVVQGHVCETRYRTPDAGAPADAPLVQTSCATAGPGDVIFINDALGLHKVGAVCGDGCDPAPPPPSAGCPAGMGAMTLHLYSPPFSQCCVWMDPCRADRVMRPRVTYYSEHGRVIDYAESGICGDATCGAAAASNGADCCGK
jgi:cysteine dioxygenase